MGACFSAAPKHVVSVVNGDEADFSKRFSDDRVLGEGQFGQVRLVHDRSVASDNAASIPRACKVLRKGVLFKDNILYSPIKPEVLNGEVNILRVLSGDNHCLKLIAVYESPRLIYVVTEFCGGGELMEYVSKQPADLSTEDVSRIAYQILSAVAHCERHSVMHRDIKAENVMFQDGNPKASLRLIDFGCGKWDEPPDSTNSVHSNSNGMGGKELQVHTTFAGSGFYISPEMYKKSYTLRTDIWSAGVTLYVLVAGYPSENLETAFHLLQSKRRKLRDLPNMPPDMPDSFYDLLEAMLTHRYKKRPSAGELLKKEFVLFHKHLDDEDNVGRSGPGKGYGRTASVVLRGTVGRHSVIFGFKKFERSLTTLMAAMLSKYQLDHFIKILDERIDAKIASSNLGDHPSENASKSNDNADESAAEGQDAISQEQKLRVLPVKELKAVLKDELKNDDVVSAMENLTNEGVYGNYAYHMTLLKDVCQDNVVSDGKHQKDTARSRSVIMHSSSVSKSKQDPSLAHRGRQPGARRTQSVYL